MSLKITDFIEPFSSIYVLDINLSVKNEDVYLSSRERREGGCSCRNKYEDNIHLFFEI